MRRRCTPNRHRLACPLSFHVRDGADVLRYCMREPPSSAKKSDFLLSVCLIRFLSTTSRSHKIVTPLPFGAKSWQLLAPCLSMWDYTLPYVFTPSVESHCSTDRPKCAEKREDERAKTFTSQSYRLSTCVWYMALFHHASFSHLLNKLHQSLALSTANSPCACLRNRLPRSTE
jgi:hypothetical protein